METDTTRRQNAALTKYYKELKEWNDHRDMLMAFEKEEKEFRAGKQFPSLVIRMKNDLRNRKIKKVDGKRPTDAQLADEEWVQHVAENLVVNEYVRAEWPGELPAAPKKPVAGKK